MTNTKLPELLERAASMIEEQHYHLSEAEHQALGRAVTKSVKFVDSVEPTTSHQAGAAEVSDEQIDSILWIGERATPEKLRKFARKVLALKAGGVGEVSDTSSLTLAIQRLNVNPYNMTKQECITLLQELRDDILALKAGGVA